MAKTDRVPSAKLLEAALILADELRAKNQRKGPTKAQLRLAVRRAIFADPKSGQKGNPAFKRPGSLK